MMIGCESSATNLLHSGTMQAFSSHITRELVRDDETAAAAELVNVISMSNAMPRSSSLPRPSHLKTHRFNMDRRIESKQVGRRLLPNYIDVIAVEDPTKLAILQTISFHPPVKFDVTYQDLSNIVNRLAWWLTECLHGKARGTTIAYLGPSDARHLFLSLAAVKAGSKLLMLSPRNSVPIHEHLIKETAAPAVLYDASFSSVASELTALEINAIQAPGLEDVLQDTSLVNEYPYHDTFDDASNKPLVAYHTSGSTGMPKPVTYVHAALAATDNLRTLYSDETHRVCRHRVIGSARSIYNGCPLFHAAGYDAGNFMLLSGTTVVIGPPNQPSSSQMFKEILHMTEVEGALLPPLVVDHVAEDPTMVEEVSRLKFISYGGGSASQKAGSLLSQRVLMLNLLGSSECGLLGCYVTEPDNWDWFHYAERELGITWEPADREDPDLYELVLYRKDLPQKQATFANFPDLYKWHTKDIFRRHPTIPYYYKYHCRKDDVIVFSTGEKTNPIDVEASISSLPGVEASLVIGHNRPYPILLVELASPLNDVLPAIHQTLEETNKRSVQYAQIHRGDILIAPSEKPFTRTPKGTINRNQTNKLYEAEIQAHYASAENPAQQTQLDASTDETLAESIAEMVGSLTGVKDLGVDDDFFVHGLDSRQVQMLAAALVGALEQGDILFLRNAVYMNPTARGLVDYINRNVAEDVSKTFDNLFNKYSSILPQPPKPPTASKSTHHVLLTGSTGFVGSFILQSLLQRPGVMEITCINRRIPEPGCSTTIVKHFKGDLSQPLFDLPEEDYNHILSTVTEIIHCQWPVTFNLPLALFEPQIAGVANLVRLAYESPQNTSITFLSSIGTVQGWDRDAPVPETPLDLLKYAQGGYGQSKLLASKLLDQAAITSGIPSAICRIGQVAGPVVGDGVWPERDWYPTLLRASKIMGVLPKSLGRFDDLDWLPVDFLSEALVTSALDLVKATDGTAYYHFSNPSVSSYRDLVPIISRRISASREIELVDFLAEWNERLSSWTLDAATDDRESVEPTMTAAKALLEFYQGLADLDQPVVRLDTSLTVGKIPALKDAGAVNEGWMERWLDQWGFE